MNKLAALAAMAATAAAFGTAGVLAQSNDSFARADGNNSGEITFQEARGRFPTITQNLFDQADSNHNGVLDETEWGEIGALMGDTGPSPKPEAPPPAPEEPAPSSSSVPS
jgi:hypothetical protein